MKLSYEAVQVIRADIAQRLKADAIQHVVDGGDLDYGKVSRLEFLMSGTIVVDPEDLDALLCEGDAAERVRSHIDKQVRLLTQAWFTTERGARTLAEAVEIELQDEIEVVEGRT